MLRQLNKGDEVFIRDIHPDDPHFKKRYLLIDKKAFILNPPSKRWIRNKHLKKWLSLSLQIDGEEWWFWAIQVEKHDPYFDNIVEP